MWFNHKASQQVSSGRAVTFIATQRTHNVFPSPCHSWEGWHGASPKSAPLPARCFPGLAVPPSLEPQKGRALMLPTHVYSRVKPVSWNQHGGEEALNDTSIAEEWLELEGSQLLPRPWGGSNHKLNYIPNRNRNLHSRVKDQKLMAWTSSPLSEC